MYYFDNSATTKPSSAVMNVFQQVSLDYFANPSSIHQLGEDAKALMQQARQQIADILGFEQQEIFFTSSGTEANNWVFKGILESLHEIHPHRSRIIVSDIEHASITAQIPFIEARGYHVDVAPVNKQGQMDLEKLKELLDDDVLILSTMAVNNEIGSIQPLTHIANMLSDYPQVIWHVDAIQAVTTQLELIHQSRIDILSLSSHKFHSVRGVGILAKRQRVSSYPLLYGGGQELGQRSSTENLAGIVATSKALRIAFEYQSEAQMKLGRFQQQIKTQFVDLGWKVFTLKEASQHIICAALPPIPGEVLVHALEAHDVFVSTTSACSSRRNSEHATLGAMGVPDNVSKSAIRISMGITTQQNEVDYLCEKLKKITNNLRK